MFGWKEILGLMVLLVVIAMSLWFGGTWLISLFGLRFGLIALVLIVMGLAGGIFSLIYFYLAPNNYFFTFVKEATAKIVVKGNKFEKALIQWRGYTLTNEWKVIRGEEKHRFGGLRYYGRWPLYDIYIYDFKWTGVTEDGKIQPHPKETLDYILLKDDVYWCKIEKAEDAELLPLDIELILTIRIVNPYKALFAIENWLETVINRIKPSVRDYISENTYANLIRIEKRETIGSDLKERVKELIGEFRRRYGVELRKIGVKEIAPPKDYVEATLKKWSAEREKERIATIAEAEAGRIATVYGAVEARGKLGELIRTLEALEKSPEKGAKWVIPLPGMADILSRVFPGRTAESIKPEEIKALLNALLGPLREQLEKLTKEVEALKQTKKGD